MRREIFVPARGQYDNIGDILLRRQLLDWLRDSGPLHVYVGASPHGYDDGLRLRPEDVRYRSFRSWYLAALRSSARGTGSYVFKPGEIQLTLLGMKEHLSMLPVIALARARRGAVARVGVGSRNFAPLPRALIWPSIALSSVSLWRDAATAEYLGHGEVMPDLAFGDGDGESAPAGRRDLLAVSMRSDRPYPSKAWLEAVRSLADRRGLDIVAVTQVLRDDEKSARLAADLGGTAVRWNGTAHHEHEERLRAVYRRAALTVSDRLHVLVAALTEGAVPAALLVDSSDKIARHFAAAGIHDISVPSAGLDAEDIVRRLDDLLGRRAPILAQLSRARAELEAVRRRLARVLASESLG